MAFKNLKFWDRKTVGDGWTSWCKTLQLTQSTMWHGDQGRKCILTEQLSFSKSTNNIMMHYMKINLGYKWKQLVHNTHLYGLNVYIFHEPRASQKDQLLYHYGITSQPVSLTKLVCPKVLRQNIDLKYLCRKWHNSPLIGS